MNVDILHAILHEMEGIGELRNIQVTTSCFSNVEYFCALALYKAAMAFVSLKSLENVKQVINDWQNLPANILPPSLSEAIANTLEAQAAIDLARQFEILADIHSSKHQQDWLKHARQALAKQAIQARFGDKRQIRRQRIIALYQEGKETDRFFNVNHAAHLLVKEVEVISEELNIPNLKIGAEIDTIKKWLYDYEREKKIANH